MKKHLLVKRLVFTIITLLLTTSVWAQQKLSGGGTKENPYVISDLADWNTFADINNAEVYWGSNVYIVLDNNIGNLKNPITKTVGTEKIPYRGNFDGNWHTLMLGINGSKAHVAPFANVESAHFQRFKVEGTITTTAKYAGGVVGWAVNTLDNPTTITNCTSNVTIVSDIDGDGTHGGFVGQNQSGKIVIENCIFEGRISGVNTTKCAGFIGWVNGAVVYNNCTMAGVITISSLDETFHRSNKITETYNNACYIRDYSDGKQGEPAPTTVPENNLYKRYTDSFISYYLPITIDFQTAYVYTGANITINPTLIYYGDLLAEDNDYTFTINGESVNYVKEIADYTIRIEATATGVYDGSYETTISVVDENTWSGLRALLSQANMTCSLSTDYQADADDEAMRINGTVVLNLNGHTINRNLSSKQSEGCVIYVSPGASLVINGNGVIKGGNNIGNGGGIYNEGTLILNNVIIRDNTANINYPPFYGTGGGVYCEGANSVFRMEGGELINNTSYGGGGGIHAKEIKEFNMSGVVVSGNTSTSKGAGIRVRTLYNHYAFISDCQIYDNIVKKDDQSKGGGVYFEPAGNNAHMVLTNCTIQSNSVTEDGGGLYIHDSGIITLDNCTISNNIAKKPGGGIYVDAKTVVNMQGNVIVNDNDGSGIYDNVYFVKSNGLINITGDISNTSRIAVSRSGNAAGVITNGLPKYEGTKNNFISDYHDYMVKISDDGEAEFYLGSSFIKNGYWNVGENWSTGNVPSVGSDVTIEAHATIPNEYTANVGEITLNGEGSITIDDGGQLKCDNSVNVAVKKEITAAAKKDEEVYGWYTISSPINTPVITSATNLITSSAYDLLRYNELTTMWESYKAHDVGDFAELENGRGYIYRNASDITVTYTGMIVTGNVSVEVTNKGENLTGFNLIGNPYTHKIYKGSSGCAIENGDVLSTGFYRLSHSGSWEATKDDNRAIMPGEGILVKAVQSTELTITNTDVQSLKRSNNDYIRFTVANSHYEDVTYAIFDEGYGLPKLSHRNKDIPMIYINQDGEDYAIATMGDETKSFNLSFKAKTTGQYTLSYEKDGKFSYLHVIDKLAGRDIDMLIDEEYTFIGSPKDTDARFIVRLDYNGSTNENESFAYQNGNDIVVSGEGELQVYDAMGRMVLNRRINGVETINLNANGVYILKLIGDDILTQKMVVR